ncbi:butyrophilin subfamily 2 member A2-like [Anoplopoma fimbria]|uniref:butyrophilin subfamily 2 member A2-like n=1 Tax=Anoplopoma fimbria TaxID=229290 RepID=UPI0023EA9CCF|nr:butyrophilin subfamily 2 member A2-like [Anoplopoma fimbria]
MATFMILVFLLFEGAAGLINEITVEPGQNAILNCSVSRTSDIRAVEWIKQGEPSKDILFYSDGHFNLEHQHQSFSGRVNLADLELKDGDVSLILKNVSAEDNGRYKCLVATGGARRTKRSHIDDTPVEVIQLVVKGSQNENSINENSINENSINENSINEVMTPMCCCKVTVKLILCRTKSSCCHLLAVYRKRINRKPLQQFTT